MPQQNEDRAGIVLFPFIALFAGAIFSALLISNAIDIDDGLEQERYTSARNQIIGAGIRAVAEMLGVSGSMALGALIVVPSLVWFVFGVKKYRREQPTA